MHYKMSNSILINMGRINYLLLSVEETGKVICVQVIFEVAVGEHEEVQIPAS